MRWRIAGGLAVGSSAIAALCGCTVPADGVLGVQREQDGSFRAVVQLCVGAHVDGVTVYSGEGSGSETVTEVEFGDRVTATGGVELSELFTSLEPGITYSSYAWSADNSSSARGPEFSISDLQAIENGYILAVNYSTDHSQTSFSPEEFEAMVLDGFCAP